MNSLAWLFWLLTLNSVVNPWIYMFFNVNLVEVLWRLCCPASGCCPCSPRCPTAVLASAAGNGGAGGGGAGGGAGRANSPGRGAGGQVMTITSMPSTNGFFSHFATYIFYFKNKIWKIESKKYPFLIGKYGSFFCDV